MTYPANVFKPRTAPGHLEPGQSLTTVPGVCLNHSQYDMQKW
jgi:hypothetical protein